MTVAAGVLSGLPASPGVAATLAPDAFRTVAFTGSAAPGTAAGVNYSGFGLPVLNAAGQTAFRGALTGTGVNFTNGGGIWSEGAGALGLVVRTGSAAPGTAAGVSYSGFGDPVLNAAGQTAFLGRLTGASVDGSNSRGIWSEGAGALGLVARTGSAAPGTAAGVNYLEFNTPLLNAAGQTTFRGDLIGTGVDGSNNEGIWAEDSGALGLVARTGSAAPGTAAGANYSFIFKPALNAAGQTAFAGILTGTGVDFFNGRGIWSTGSGALDLVVRSGSAAPGTAAGVNFFDFNKPALNAAGQTAFVGHLTGTGVDTRNNVGIWSEGSGSLGLVARKGSAAPGTAAGANYFAFNNPVLNAAGQTAFLGILSGTGVDGSNDRGIWATDPDGRLILVIREGDLFDVADDPINPDFRTVASFSVFSNLDTENNRPSPFINDAGQLVFRASFTDGTSGVFVANTTSAALALPGDYNDSGQVEQGDLNLVLNNWGQPRPFAPNGDPFTTTKVDQEELNRVLNNWGSTTPPFQNVTPLNVPEPAWGLTLALAGFTLRRMS
ncbi:MAG: choice-of-anchor tandem repeat NxxGxxAF-containing protein [Planctomycetota bacterium]